MKKIIVGFQAPNQGVLGFLRAVPRHILVNTVSTDVCLFLRKNGINCACSRIDVNRMFIEPGDIVVLNIDEISSRVAVNCPGVVVIDPADYSALASELQHSPDNEVSSETRRHLLSKIHTALQAVSEL